MKMRAEGQTLAKIAKHFGISCSRAGHILKAERQRLVSMERAKYLCQNIRASNDVDKNIPIDDLFCMLALPRRAATVLRAFFTLTGKVLP